MPRCPVCSAAVDLVVATAAPFCSERCRLIDLGRWLGESYQVPLPRHAAEDDEDEQAGTGGPAHPADDE